MIPPWIKAEVMRGTVILPFFSLGTFVGVGSGKGTAMG
jgi:hypothetical protein